MRKKQINRVIASFLIILLTLSTLLLCSCAGLDNRSAKVHMAVAWSNKPDSLTYESTITAAKETGAEVTTLDLVKSRDLKYDGENHLTDAKDNKGMLTSQAAKQVKCNTYLGSNVDEVMKDIDCVVFPGGWDISPTLYYKEQPWHGIKSDGDYCAERDVSDYLLLSYCLEKDIPVYCICRGMQMLAIVSGADMIQDIGTYYQNRGIAYHDTHRDPAKKNFMPHDVKVLSHDSLFYQMSGKDVF